MSKHRNTRPRTDQDRARERAAEYRRKLRRERAAKPAPPGDADVQRYQLEKARAQSRLAAKDAAIKASLNAVLQREREERESRGQGGRPKRNMPDKDFTRYPDSPYLVADEKPGDGVEEGQRAEVGVYVLKEVVTLEWTRTVSMTPKRKSR